MKFILAWAVERPPPRSSGSGGKCCSQPLEGGGAQTGTGRVEPDHQHPLRHGHAVPLQRLLDLVPLHAVLHVEVRRVLPRRQSVPHRWGKRLLVGV